MMRWPYKTASLRPVTTPSTGKRNQVPLERDLENAINDSGETGSLHVNCAPNMRLGN